MSYEVIGHILGFENIKNVEINEVDELFSTMTDVDNKNISFTILSPYILREYSFDLPASLKVLLEIHKDSNVSVYNVVVVQKPLENSVINFLAPIIVNNDNNKVAQAVLNPKKHPEFGYAETIKTFNR
jgi:flagellar assembly factor FliW